MAVKVFVTKRDITRAFGLTGRMFRKMKSSGVLRAVRMPGYRREVYYRAVDVEAELGEVEQWHARGAIR
jgi:hypothetical protein